MRSKNITEHIKNATIGMLNIRILKQFGKSKTLNKQNGTYK